MNLTFRTTTFCRYTTAADTYLTIIIYMDEDNVEDDRPLFIGEAVKPPCGSTQTQRGHQRDFSQSRVFFSALYQTR